MAVRWKDSEVDIAEATQYRLAETAVEIARANPRRFASHWAEVTSVESGGRRKLASKIMGQLATEETALGDSLRNMRSGRRRAVGELALSGDVWALSVRESRVFPPISAADIPVDLAVFGEFSKGEAVLAVATRHLQEEPVESQE